MQPHPPSRHRRDGRPAYPQESAPAGDTSRGRLGWFIGLLATSGVLATIAAFAPPKLYESAAEKLSDLSGGSAIKPHVDDDGRYSGVQNTVWALTNASPHVGADGTTNPRAAGAVAINRSPVAITLENVRTHKLTVNSIKAVVKMPRLDPINGAIVKVPPGAGGAEPPPVSLAFVLDSDDLEARVLADGTPNTVHYLDQNGITLEPGEQLRLRLAGQTEKYHIAWSVKVRYVIDGEQHETQIGTDGQFQVTAASANYAKAYESSSQSLSSVPVAQICGADCRTSLARR